MFNLTLIKMKKITFIATSVFLTLFFACQKETMVMNTELIDNTEKIEQIIDVFDFTLKETIKQQLVTDKKISNADIGRLFVAQAEEKKLISTNSSFVRKEPFKFSKSYNSLIAKLEDAATFNTKKSYKTYLENFQQQVKISKLNLNEKQHLVDQIQFSIAFIDWIQQISTSLMIKFENPPYWKHSISQRKAPDCELKIAPGPDNDGDGESDYDVVSLDCSQGNWWDDWGKCAAGIISGAGSGALTFGFAGAAVGTVTLPIIGTVSAGTVGAIGGAIVGGLGGAASFC